MKISLIIPMYNESSIIADTAKTIDEYMRASFADYEVIYSDDGSLDGSADIVRGLELPNTRVVGYEKNRGKGAAVRNGVLAACGDVIMFTDADLAYGTDVIRRVYDAFEASPDTQMLIGSRNISGDGYGEYTLLRRIMSKAYIKVLCIVGGFRLSDSQCGCKAFRAESAKSIFERCTVDGFAFDFEAILWAQKLGRKISEIPVKIINHRESKVRPVADAIKMLRDLRRIKRRIKQSEK